MVMLNHRLPLVQRPSGLGSVAPQQAARRPQILRGDTEPLGGTARRPLAEGRFASLRGLGRRLHSLRTMQTRPPSPASVHLALGPAPRGRDWAMSTASGSFVGASGAAILFAAALGPAPALLPLWTAGVAGALAMGLCGAGMRRYVDLHWRALEHEPQSRAVRSAGWMCGVGMGLGIAPMPVWAIGASALPLLLAATGAVTLAASMPWWGPAPGHLPTPMEVAVGIGAALTCAVGGWTLTAGLPVTVAMWAGLNAAAVSLGLGALTTLGLSIGVRSAPTPMIDGLIAPASEVASSRFEEVAHNKSLPATIVESPPELIEAVRELQGHIARAKAEDRGLRGVFSLCLFGPPGTGKTVSAAAVAEAIDGDLATTSASALADETLAPAPVAFVRLIRCLLEADARGRRLNRMQVLFIDEFDDLFKRLDPTHNNLSSYDALGFVLLAETLSMVARNESFVVLATATNNLTTHIHELLRVISLRPPIYVGPIGEAGMKRLLELQLGEVETRLRECFGLVCAPLHEAEQAKYLLELMHARGASGRALRYATSMASDHLVSRYALAAERPTPEALREELMTRVYDHASSLSVDRRPPPAAPVHSSPAAPNKANGAQVEEWVVDMEQVMSRLKLQQMGYLEAILNISEQLLPSYVSNPETSLAVNFFGIELSVVLLRAATLYVEEISGPSAPREIRDTPHLSRRGQQPRKAEVDSLLQTLSAVVKNYLPQPLGRLLAPRAGHAS